MERKLTGVCPILPTPFDMENKIDVESLKRVVRFMLECKVSGIALFGNASEAFALTQEEKELIARVVVSENAGAVPLIFGAGGTSTETALVSCRWAESAGADVLMIMPPYMIKPNGKQVYDFYAAIASAVHTPIMIQDAPGASGVNMDNVSFWVVNPCFAVDDEFILVFTTFFYYNFCTAYSFSYAERVSVYVPVVEFTNNAGFFCSVKHLC